MNMNRIHRWYCRSGHWRRTVHSRLLPWALRGVELSGELLEIGPGPGLTTDELRSRVARLTAVELDGELARKLATRMQGTNVTVRQADATALPFDDGSFDAVVCFTMMHHIPSRELQNRMLAEACRVLAPGGVFAGSDSTTSWLFRQFHRGDTLVPVEPSTFAWRLAAAGFMDPKVTAARGAFRFRARKPLRAVAAA
jgi:SAM-dependent methyltransferase